jgi:hypothetical protein
MFQTINQPCLRYPRFANEIPLAAQSLHKLHSVLDHLDHTVPRAMIQNEDSKQGFHVGIWGTDRGYVMEFSYEFTQIRKIFPLKTTALIRPSRSHLPQSQVIQAWRFGPTRQLSDISSKQQQNTF